MAVFIIAGCANADKPITRMATVVPTRAVEATTTRPASATVIASPIATPAKVTPVVISSATVTPSAVAAEVNYCKAAVPVADSPDLSNLTGSLLILGRGNLLSIDLASSEDYLIVPNIGTRFEMAGSTGDGQWVAYVDDDLSSTGKKLLHLLSGSGDAIDQVIEAPPVTGTAPIDWYPIDWINSELLLVAAHGALDAGALPIGDETALLNPFTVTWMPGLLEQLPWRSQYASVGISPDMTRALYIAQRSYGYQLNLFDYPNQTILATFDNYGFSPNIQINKLLGMAWSPDSSQVAFVVTTPDRLESQLQVMSRNGDEHAIVLDYDAQAGYYGLQWSPNSRYLAAIVGSDTEVWPYGSVVVYDLLANTITAICADHLGGAPAENQIGNVLHWSPDSQYVVIGARTNDPTPDRILAFNPFSGTLAILRQEIGVFFVGWSTMEHWGKKP